MLPRLNRKVIKCIFLLVGLTIIGNPKLALAGSNKSDGTYNVVFRVGLSKGGDDVGSWTEMYPSQASVEEIQNQNNVQVTTNPRVRSPDGTGGGGFFFETGLGFAIGESPYWIEASIGYQSSNLFFIPGDSYSEFTKQIVNLVPTFKLGKHAIGIGFTYHLNPKFVNTSSSDIYDYYDEQLGAISPVEQLEFNNSLGVVMQYIYGAGNFKYGVKATIIDYESKSLRTQEARYDETSDRSYSRSISGNGISIFSQINFGVF